MRFFPSQEALNRELIGVQSEFGPQLGLVSIDVPLISNLDAWQNIGLIYQYHQKTSEKKAKSLVLQWLQRCSLEGIAYKRNPSLSEKERFLVMLLRAAMVYRAIIVIDRPFRIIPDLQDVSFIYAMLETIDDLFMKCYILDYSHDKSRYGMTDASEN